MSIEMHFFKVRVFNGFNCPGKKSLCCVYTKEVGTGGIMFSCLEGGGKYLGYCSFMGGGLGGGMESINICFALSKKAIKSRFICF